MIAVFIYWQNNSIQINRLEHRNIKIPNSFNGYKIVQISDLHNKEFGKNNIKLINIIKKENPDIILITWDLIDSNHIDIEVGIEFIKNIVDVAPIYYVSGNHECWSNSYDYLYQELTKMGVHILDNKYQVIENGYDIIYISGISDPEFMASNYTDKSYLVGEVIGIVTKDIPEDAFKILLSHRPELFNVYTETSIDLVFSGHAHGGQFRLPFISGILAPGQGFLPKYTEGMHQTNKTTMVVSRGLGNSTFPVRLFNNPEIVIVTLFNN